MARCGIALRGLAQLRAGGASPLLRRLVQLRGKATAASIADSDILQRQEPIRGADDYIKSLRGRNLDVYLFGEKVLEPVDHPLIWPSVNAVAETYRLAEEEPEVGSAASSLCGGARVNRFMHVTESVEDVVAQNHMQRKLGQRTGTCFQRWQVCELAHWNYDCNAPRANPL